MLLNIENRALSNNAAPERCLRLPLLILAIILFAGVHRMEAQVSCGRDLSPLFGLTTESVDDVNRLLPALQKIREKFIPTLRVVFQPAKNDREDEKMLSEYATALAQIRGNDPIPNAYILGLLVDSSSFHKFDDAKVRERARKYAEKLSNYVDIWEAGNEVNGDWVGWEKGKQEKISADELEQMRKSVGSRIKIVYDTINSVYSTKKKTARFALNLYFNDDNIDSCKDDKEKYTGRNCLNEDLKNCKGECLHDYEMFTWAKKYLKPYGMKFDYVLFSFYKDDCTQPITDAAFWVKTFAKLSEEFKIGDNVPKVGFGEVAPQCYCSVGKDGRPEQDDDKRRLAPCCRPEQPRYIRDYYQTLHSQIRDTIAKMNGSKPDYVGGFFYWYFYQDATDSSSESKRVLDAFIESADFWRRGIKP